MSDEPRETEGLEEQPAASPVLQSRRQFVVGLAAAIGAGWVGAILHRLTVAAPRQIEPVEVSVAEIPSEGALSVTYAGRPVMVRRGKGNEIEAISLVCTHLGCTVEWRSDSREFYCPCHEGKFDEEGRAIAGPPKIPLERLKVRRVGGTILVGERL